MKAGVLRDIRFQVQRIENSDPREKSRTRCAPFYLQEIDVGQVVALIAIQAKI